MLSLSNKETGLQDCFNLGHAAAMCLRPNSGLSGSKSQALSYATRLHNRLSKSVLEDLTTLCNLAVSEQNQMFSSLNYVGGGAGAGLERWLSKNVLIKQEDLSSNPQHPRKDQA